MRKRLFRKKTKAKAEEYKAFFGVDFGTNGDTHVTLFWQKNAPEGVHTPFITLMDEIIGELTINEKNGSGEQGDNVGRVGERDARTGNGGRIGVPLRWRSANGV